jgi:hypothetical protein
MNSSKPPSSSILKVVPLNIAVRLNIFNARQYNQLSYCIDFYFCDTVSDFVVSFISISLYFFYKKHFAEIDILCVSNSLDITSKICTVAILPSKASYTHA